MPLLPRRNSKLRGLSPKGKLGLNPGMPEGEKMDSSLDSITESHPSCESGPVAMS